MLNKIRSWTSRHRHITAVLFICICLVLGNLGGKAFASSPPPSKMCTHNPDTTCSVKQHVKRFKAGRFGKVHGIHVKIFASPAAKATLMRKVAHKMPAKPFRVERHATCAKAPRWVCKTTAGRGGTAAGHKRCMQSDLCRAYNRYGSLASGATCIGVDASYFHPNCIPYKLRHPGWDGFTKKQIQIGGATALCGAGVVVGIASGVGTVVVVIGAAACGWQFWSAVDPG